MNKIPVSFKETEKDMKLFTKIKNIEKQERSRMIKKILFEYFFKEEY